MRKQKINKGLHNCLKTQKVNTFPRSLMEHTLYLLCTFMIFIQKYWKKEFEIFFSSTGIRTPAAKTKAVQAKS